jgi:hypothetical protein
VGGLEFKLLYHQEKKERKKRGSVLILPLVLGSVDNKLPGHPVVFSMTPKTYKEDSHGS